MYNNNIPAAQDNTVDYIVGVDDRSCGLFIYLFFFVTQTQNITPRK